jgi:precorrin-2 methylase
MSNQRPANMKPAAMSQTDRVDLLKLTRFFKQAKEELESRGEDDAAYYFEVMTDYFTEDYKGGDISVSKALAL